MATLKATFYTTHVIRTIYTEIAKREDGVYFMRERTHTGLKKAWRYLPKGINSFKEDIRELIEKEMFAKNASEIKLPQDSKSYLDEHYI